MGEKETHAAAQHMLQGRLLCGQERWEEAVRHFTEALRLCPEDSTLFCDRGWARRSSGDLSAALEDFDQAVRFGSTWAYARVSRAALLLEMGEVGKVLDECAEAIRMEPDSYEAYALRGQARGQEGDLPGAIRDLESALRLAPAEWDERQDVADLVRVLRSG